MAGASKSKKKTTTAERTPEEKKFILARETLIEEQRRKQADEIGPVTHSGLGEKKIVSLRFINLKLFQQDKIPEIEKLVNQ